MFEWLRRRGGVQLITCASCGRTQPLQCYADFGEQNPRTYYCNDCRLIGFGPDGNPSDTLWLESRRSSEIWYSMAKRRATT